MTFAVLAVAVVQNLAFIWPGLAAPGVALPLSLAILWLFTLVNCLGVREAGTVQVITVGLKLLPLAAVILVALWLLLRGATAPVANASVPIDAASINGAADPGPVRHAELRERDVRGRPGARMRSAMCRARPLPEPCWRG